MKMRMELCRMLPTILLLLGSIYAKDESRELIIYKDREDSRCVLLRPARTELDVDKKLPKKLKDLDDIYLGDFEVTDVRKLSVEEVKSEWGEDADKWCRGHQSYELLIASFENQIEVEGKSRSKRSIGYYRRNGNSYGNYNRRNLYSKYRDQEAYQNRRQYYPTSRYDGRVQKSRSRPRVYNSPERRQKHVNRMFSDDNAAAASKGNSFVGTSPIRLDSSGGLNTYSQVQYMTSGSRADAASNGIMDGKTSDAQVSGSYTDDGTFMANAKSGFLTGETRVQAQGTEKGSSAESVANMEKLGTALSKARMEPQGISLANAEGKFGSGTTYVSSNGNSEGGRSSARANSKGQTSSNAEVVMQGAKDGNNGANYDGVSFARSGGDTKGGSAQTKVRGTNKNRNSYMAVANGAFGAYSEGTGDTQTQPQVEESGLQSVPLEYRRRRVGSNGRYDSRNGYGGGSQKRGGSQVAPAGQGPYSTKDLRPYNGRRDNSFSTRTGPLLNGGSNYYNGRYPTSAENLRRKAIPGGSGNSDVLSSNRKMCCNAQYICCAQCCIKGEPRAQGDSPSYRSTYGHKYRNDDMKRISDKAKRRVSRLLKYTNELQSDQPQPKRSSSKDYIEKLRNLARITRRNRFNYNRPKGGYTTTPKYRFTSSSYVPPMYSNNVNYGRKRANAYRSLYGSATRNYRGLNDARMKTRPKPASSRRLAIERNSNDRRAYRDPCAVQYSCSTTTRPYGKVRHCKPFKPAGCS